MKKILILVALMLSPMVTSISLAKMEIDQHVENVNISNYQDLYFQNIDVREIVFEVYDDEYNEYDQEPLDDETLKEIAIELYEHFFLNIKDVINVQEGEFVDASGRALLLNLKVSARFTAGEQGAMIKWLFKAHGSESIIYLKCELLDAMTQQVLFTVTDEHPFKLPQQDSPLSSVEEMERLTQIFRAWAKRFGKVFHQMQKSSSK